MKQKGFAQYIAERVGDYSTNSPIYNSEVARDIALHFDLNEEQARALVNVNLPRVAEKSGLVRYSKGIYYRPGNSAFGQTRLNPALISRDRYLVQGNEIIGYVTGALFLNQLGLTTQVPKYMKIATNRFIYRGSRTDNKLQIILCRPKTRITRENHLILQLLDAIENKDKVDIDHPNPTECIWTYIAQRAIRMEDLVAYAGNFFNNKTQVLLVKIIAGAIHETTPRFNIVSNSSIDPI